MRSMFQGAENANPNVRHWDVSNVKSMEYLFLGLKRGNPDVSQWDTSNVENMLSMFYGAELADPDVSNFNTANVTTMGAMFGEAKSANPDVSKWNTSKVTDMRQMFYKTDVANPDVSNWDTSNVVTMREMFSHTKSANPNVTNWNTAKVESMGYMFILAEVANPDVSNWDLSSVTDMEMMFTGAHSVNNIVLLKNSQQGIVSDGMFINIVIDEDDNEVLTPSDYNILKFKNLRGTPIQGTYFIQNITDGTEEYYDWETYQGDGMYYFEDNDEYHVYKAIALNVKVNWEDRYGKPLSGDALKNLTAGIDVYRDGDAAPTTFDVGQDDNFEMKQLVRYIDDNGEVIHYTVKEQGESGGQITVDGTTYDVTVTGNPIDGFVITNREFDPTQPTAPEDNDTDLFRFDLTFLSPTPLLPPADDEAEVTETHTAYMVGYEDGTLRPEEHVTRAEAAALVTRLAGLDLTDRTQPNFEDTEADAWYIPYINAAVAHDLLLADGSAIRPNAPITRGEFARMLAPLDKDNDTVAAFADIKGHPYEAAINREVGNHIIEGYDDGTFRPEAKLTRAEAAAMLNRLYNRVADEDALMDGYEAHITPYTDVSKGAWYYYDLLESTTTHTLVRRDAKDEYGRTKETWRRIVQDAKVL
ncbi:BspA family leucine-rich repeat surface protein [Peptoniphilus equinus]|uniref:BspA family leucine-rich repeat surface protein n=1 Tax=Peptoniphilus equinus TaxID=3016343 RepID=A0ABY7QU18_9FIRM|nr:BspA family leucine-rich repeat surface protein [Peptoniphilus equinus]WBW50267.1 BspA family leucine-rich repeat surface protein [Peptoniphilus equinus]